MLTPRGALHYKVNYDSYCNYKLEKFNFRLLVNNYGPFVFCASIIVKLCNFNQICLHLHEQQSIIQSTNY